MSGISTYGAVATKIRGMRAHLLKNEDYARLANCPNVREIVVYLKSHPSYGPILEDVDPDNMRRETVERIILRSVFNDFAKIAHFLDRDRKKFLRVYAAQYELRLINNVIREIFNPHTDPVNLSVYRPMYEGSPNFDFDKVIAAKSIEELAAALEGSVYLAPIEKTMKNLDNPALFDYETAVNRFYFAYFWEALKTINSKSDKDTLMDIHGTEIDFLNILWIYRAKAFYKVTPQEIYNFLIPAYHKLKNYQVVQMVGAQSAAEVLNLIAQTGYGKYLDPQDPSSLERAYMLHIAKMNTKTRRDNPYSFAVIGAYAHDKKNEVDRIVRIAESVRYGYDPKLILSALDIEDK